MVSTGCKGMGFPPLMVGCVISLMLGLQLFLICLGGILCVSRVQGPAPTAGSQDAMILPERFEEQGRCEGQGSRAKM